MIKNPLRKLVCLVLALLLMTGSASSMMIHHNVTALNAHRNLTNHNSSLKQSLEKLSNGYSINRAGDDAAGLAIREQMRAQITGLEAATENARYASSMVQTAEEAYEEAHTMMNHLIDLGLRSGWERTDSGWRYNFSRLDDSSLGIGCPGSDGSEMTLLVNRTSAGFAFDQFAFDAAGAGYGSDNPQSILVSSKGDLGIVSAGEAFIIGFDSNGNVTNSWVIGTDGEEVFELPNDTQDGLVWSSSDENVATVDPETGAVTAVGAGTATITATQGGQMDSVKITVRKPSGIPLERVLTNDGVKAIENKQIPSNAIVTVRWPAPEVSAETTEINGVTYWQIDGEWFTWDDVYAMWGDDFPGGEGLTEHLNEYFPSEIR